MIFHPDRFLYALALAAALTVNTGCNTAGGRAGGAAGGDPLAEHQLGSNAELDADIAAITDSFNQALACAGADAQFTSEQNLEGLKQSYAGPPGDFPRFVDETRVKNENRTREICDTELGDNPELDELVARLTVAINRGRQCRGEGPTRTDAQSLLAIKQSWLDTGFVFNSLIETAEDLVPAAEAVADRECGQEE